MTTPWGCSPIWDDVPPVPRAILWGIAEELREAGCTSAPSGARWGNGYGVIVAHRGTQNRVLVALRDGIVGVDSIPVGQHERATGLLERAFGWVHRSIEHRYRLADPGSIAQITEKVRELLFEAREAALQYS